MARLTDAELANHATEQRRLKAISDQYLRQAHEHRDAAVAELQARRKLEETVGGVRVVLKTSKRTLHLGRARERFGRRKVLAAVTRTSIDRQAWDAEKRAGRLTAEDEMACLVDTPVTPYVLVYAANKPAAG